MATDTYEIWTEDKCLQLIREYRARSFLWDQKNPFFFKRTTKLEAWEDIGTSLNISADECKNKMIILMSSFRREKAKIMHSLRTVDMADSSKVYKSTWFAFKEMAFLLDKESERKRALNDSDKVDNDNGNESTSSIKSTLLSHHLDAPPSKRIRPLLSVRKDLQQKFMNEESEEPSIPSLLPNPGPSQASAELDDEIKSFVSFIGNKMKKYSVTTKNAVQHAICSIIFQADQDYYENNSYEKLTSLDAEPDPLRKQMLEDDSTIIKIENFSDSE